MRVAEIMTRGVQTVPASLPAAEAWELMRAKRFHHLVVVDGSRVTGVLSARDAGGRHGGAVRDRSTVAELMTAPVLTVGPEMTVRKVANLLRGRTIGCVPVVDGKRLVGIVTVSDLLELLGRGFDRPTQPERRNLHHRVPHRHRKGTAAFGVW